MRMSVLENLQEINKHIVIYDMHHGGFLKYGRVLPIETVGFGDCMGHINIKNGYCMSEALLEQTDLFRYFKNSFYGGMPIQAGICAGDNTKLNCLEYHRGTEINIAATDMVLLLANLNDMKNNCIGSEKIEAFYIPKGKAVSLFETTLHYSPLCVYSKGFACIVILPKGTNEKLEKKPAELTKEDALLFDKNKWLIGHCESTEVKEKGAFLGITGENIHLYPL